MWQKIKDKWRDYRIHRAYKLGSIVKADTFHPPMSVMISAGGLAFSASGNAILEAAAGNWLMVLAMVGTACGGGARFIRDIDAYAVARHIEGKNINSIARRVYRLFNNTPLRLYTLNQFDIRLENAGHKTRMRQLRHQEKEKKREAYFANKPVDPHVIPEGIQNERTYEYLARQADAKKHLRKIFYLAVALFAVLRSFTMASNGKVVTPTQVAARIGGYIYGVTYAVAHVGAYVKRRSRENNARPFFLIGAKIVNKLPTSGITNWLLHRNLQNYKDLVAGRQPLSRRIEQSIYKKIPIPGLRHWAVKLHERGDLKLTSGTMKRLEEDGLLQKFENLEFLLAKKNIEPTAPLPSLRESWSSYVNSCTESETALTGSCRQYIYNIDNQNKSIRYLETALDQFDKATKSGHWPQKPMLEDMSHTYQLNADDRGRASSVRLPSAGSWFLPGPGFLRL